MGLAVLGSYMASRFAAGLKDSLSAEVKQALPPDQLAEMSKNPQALVNPQALEGLKAGFADQGTQGAAILEQLLTTTRLRLGFRQSTVPVPPIAARAHPALPTGSILTMPPKPRSP